MSVTRGCFRHPLRSYEIVKSVLNYIHCILLVNSGPSVAQWSDVNQQYRDAAPSMNTIAAINWSSTHKGYSTQGLGMGHTKA